MISDRELSDRVIPLLHSLLASGLLHSTGNEHFRHAVRTLLDDATTRISGGSVTPEEKAVIEAASRIPNVIYLDPATHSIDVPGLMELLSATRALRESRTKPKWYIAHGPLPGPYLSDGMVSIPARGLPPEGVERLRDLLNKADPA